MRNLKESLLKETRYSTYYAIMFPFPKRRIYHKLYTIELVQPDGVILIPITISVDLENIFVG